MRDRALFDLAIDSKLRGCHVVKIRIGDLVSGGRVRARVTVTPQKTGRPVQFELLGTARISIQAWLERRGGTLDDYVFPSRTNHAPHLGTRQYARLVDEWVTGIGLRREDYGTHSLRRTKASIIYKAIGNSRAVEILLGHANIESRALPWRRCRRRAVHECLTNEIAVRTPSLGAGQITPQSWLSALVKFLPVSAPAESHPQLQVWARPQSGRSHRAYATPNHCPRCRSDPRR